MKKLDEAFKKIFQDREIFFEFLQMFLPDIVSKYSITLDSLILENIEKISSSLRSKRADVIYRIKTKDLEAFIFVLLEHQSRKDYLMPFRMLEYTVAIWRHFIDEVGEKAKRKQFKLPPVIPIVLYDGYGRWTVQRDISEKVRKVPGYERYVPRYEYMVINVNELEKDWLMDFESVLSKILVIDGVRKEQIRDMIKELSENVKKLPEDKRKKLIELLHVMMIGAEAAEEGEKELEEMEEVEGMFSRLVKELKKEGRIEGRLEGKMEAIVEATIDALEERFGYVPEDVKDKLSEVKDIKKLKILFRKSIVVKSIDEFRDVLESV